MKVVWQQEVKGKHSMCVYGSMSVKIYNMWCVCIYVDSDVCMNVWGHTYMTSEPLNSSTIPRHPHCSSSTFDIRMYFPLTTVGGVYMSDVRERLPAWFACQGLAFPREGSFSGSGGKKAGHPGPHVRQRGRHLSKFQIKFKLEFDEFDVGPWNLNFRVVNRIVQLW
jgi:hypothetical protein